MPKVKAREGEPFPVLLKRFKKACEKASLLSDVKKNKYYIKPSKQRREEAKAARRKALKQARKNSRYNR